MKRRHTVSLQGLCAALCLALIPCLAVAPATAQTASGSIAGVVKDDSGAVLPGVTIEASSPALIEKVRTVTSDDQGAYKIVDLRPLIEHLEVGEAEAGWLPVRASLVCSEGPSARPSEVLGVLGVDPSAARVVRRRTRFKGAQTAEAAPEAHA